MGLLDLFPQEIIHDVPRITLTGCDDLLVEQHRGLVVYTQDKIVFLTGVGELHIEGDSLSFIAFSSAAARISGKIMSIRFVSIGGM